jgi:hypothetical protein
LYFGGNVKKYFNKIFLFFYFLFFCGTIVFSAQLLEVIDTPVTNLHSAKNYSFDTLVYKDGGMINSFVFGLVNRFNIGFSIDFYRLISDEDMKTRPPRLKLKVNAYQGNRHWPALTFGYDGQGLGLYDEKEREYSQREKGLYMVIGRELFLRNLFFDAGINMYDFSDKKVYSFLNANYSIFRDRFVMLLEYDNIRVAKDARLNTGFRYYLNDELSMGLALRKINQDKDREGSLERTLQITYTSNF